MSWTAAGGTIGVRVIMSEGLESVPFTAVVGERLRQVRRARRLTLEDVASQSDGRWSSSAIGSYERGARKLSVGGLRDFAEFYGVPMSVLVEDPPDVDPSAPPPDRLVLDMVRVEAEPECAPFRHYVRSIVLDRGDFNGRVLSLRKDDIRAISALLKATDDGAFRRLREWGALIEP